MRKFPNRGWMRLLSAAGAVAALAGCAEVETDTAEQAAEESAVPGPAADDMAAEEPGPEGHFEPVDPDEGEPEN